MVWKMVLMNWSKIQAYSLHLARRFLQKDEISHIQPKNIIILKAKFHVIDDLGQNSEDREKENQEASIDAFESKSKSKR